MKQLFLKVALMQKSFTLIHNYPSGDPPPIQQDFEITHRLSKTGKTIEINKIDHIIIGSNDSFSFPDEGLL